MSMIFTPDDLRPIFDKMQARVSELDKQLSDPAIFADNTKSGKYLREHKHLDDLLALFRQWEKDLGDVVSLKHEFEQEQDSEMRSLLEAEISEINVRIEAAQQSLLVVLMPPDPHDARNTIMEIRPGAGGDEAALFVADMFRMYSHYAEQRGWKLEILDMTETGLGGIKEVIFSLSGADVFSRLKFESGVHRVQRIPETEAGGRIHTSTITVAVLPEVEECDDIEIRPEDLEISTFRSSGPGGQHVNKTDSAVRILHKPSGMVVASQQERSQIRNREIALMILKSRLLEQQRRKDAAEQAENKRSQVGTGDRSERIRTYNYPQNRITDHRYNVSIFDLPKFMEGNLDMILNPIFELVGKQQLESALNQ